MQHSPHLSSRFEKGIPRQVDAPQSMSLQRRTLRTFRVRTVAFYREIATITTAGAEISVVGSSHRGQVLLKYIARNKRGRFTLPVKMARQGRSAVGSDLYWIAKENKKTA